MTSLECNVFFVDRYGQPVFAQKLAESGNFRLAGITELTQPHVAREILANSHVYQVSSGVNELPFAYSVRAEFLSRTPCLLMVSTIGAGHDTVDVEACTRRGIVVVNQSGGANAQAVAEHTLAMVLALGKRVVEADRHTRSTPNLVRGNFVGRNLQGKTVGLVGFGNVGKRLAVICTQAFGNRVLVCSGNVDASDIAQHGAEKVTLPTLLQVSDFVVVCCALTTNTRGLIGARQFAMMQRHAYFVTTARAGIHDEGALILALEGGLIAGAGIDVWDQEPPDLDHPLLKLDNVIATPHIAGATVESRTDASESAARQIVQAFSGEQPRQLLNPEVWELFLQRLAQAFPLGVGAGRATSKETA
jgi:D-3-phosphoglycerate dehydrogenase